MPQIAVFTPAIIAVSLVMALFKANPSAEHRAGILAVMLGASVIASYFAVALIIHVVDLAGHRVFTPQKMLALEVMGYLIGILNMYLFFRSLRKKEPAMQNEIRAGRSAKHLSVVIASVALLTLVIVGTNPVSGWDSLGLWTFEAHRFLQYDQAGYEILGLTRDQGAPYPVTHPRHPLTIVYISAFGAAMAEQSSLFRGWMLPWTIIWISGASIVWGFVLYTSRNHLCALAATCLYCTTPLLENYAGLVGYADPWIASVVLASASLISIGIYNGDRNKFLLGVSYGLLPLAVKNTGIIYTAALLSALYIIFMLRLRTAKYQIGLLSLLIFAGLLTINSVAPDLLEAVCCGGLKSQPKVTFGGYEMDIGIISLAKVAANHIWALFINQSYSVLVAIVIIAALSLRGTFFLENCGARDAQFFLLSTTFFIIIFFAGPQFIEDYSAIYAFPESDTGASRFIMPASYVSILAIGLALNSMTPWSAQDS